MWERDHLDVDDVLAWLDDEERLEALFDASLLELLPEGPEPGPTGDGDPHTVRREP